MLKYRALFRLRFIGSLQYRTAAIAGIVTQFAWGFLEVLMFRAFYQADSGAFPMAFSAVVSYVWLQQAFLALYMLWFWENDIFESIQSGGIAYELVRPVSVYNMWFVRSIATRMAKTVLRCLPILAVALLLPAPFNLSLPSSLSAFSWFVVTMMLALGVIVTLNMLIYFLAFFTLNAFGIRMVFQSLGDLLSGAIIPLPFFPERFQQVLSFLPFSAIQNVPFRIYSGDLRGEAMYQSILMQVLWIVLLLIIGKVLEARVVKNVVIQGG